MPSQTLKGEAPQATKSDREIPYRERIEQNCMILTESQGIQPLVIEPQQHRILDAIEASEARTGFVRLVILKPRRMRCTTIIQARNFDVGSHSPTPGQCYILTNDQRVKFECFDMMDRYRNNWVSGDIEAINKRRPSELKLENDYQFTFDILNDYAGSSSTLMLVHATEVAKARGAKSAMDSVMPAAKYAGVIEESTANGQLGDGQYFFDQWTLAASGNSEWMGLFMGWQDHPHYHIEQEDRRFNRLMYPEEDTWNKGFLAEEQGLMKAYGLSVEQLAWRRYTIQTECGGDVDFFRQDYPSDPSEAFLKVEGMRVFDMDKCRVARLAAIESNKQTPPAIGRLEWNVKPILDLRGFCQNREALEVGFVEDPQGSLRVWEFPSKRMDSVDNGYAGASDIAKGVEGGDSNDATILNRWGSNISASWHELSSATMFGDSLAKLAMWYNCQIAVELDGVGDATITRMLQLVGGDYVWAKHKRSPGQIVTETDFGKWGWKAMNRHDAVTALIDVVLRKGWEDHDEEAWTEIMNVTREASGAPKLNGMDRTASRCILAHLDRMLPPAYIPPEPVIDYHDYDASVDESQAPPAADPRTYGMREHSGPVDHRTHGLR